MEDLLVDQETNGGLITRFWTNLNKVGQQNITVDLLEARLATLTRYWENYYDRHMEIARLDAASTSEYLCESVFDDIEAIYVSTVAKIQALIKTKVPPAPPPQHAAPQAAANAAAAAAAGWQAQLPKLQVPKFNGDQLQWESFRDMFTAMVVDIPGISNVLKLKYLKSNLTGDAAQLLKNMPITGDNYEAAWTSLENRYGNKRVLLSAHLKNILSCPPATKESAAEIKRLLDLTNETIRAITNLARPVQHWDDWFVHLLTQKLDGTTRKDWETSLINNQEFPRYEQLSAFLESRVRALEAANPASNSTKSNASNNNSAKSRKTNTASHLTVDSREEKTNDPVSDSEANPRDNPQQSSRSETRNPSRKPKPGSQCPVCQSLHFVAYCPRFKQLGPRQRREQTQQLNLCLNCLRRNHSVNECPSDKRCLTCQGKHHTILHGSVAATSTETSVTSDRESNQLANVTANTSTSSCLVNNVVSLAARTTGISLLATALVVLESPSGHAVTVKALLDQGSEDSFVTEHVVQTLHLPRRAVHVTMRGLGASVLGTITSRASLSVRSMQSPSASVPFDAFVLKKLTTHTPGSPIPVRNWSHLHDLTLADPTFHEPSRVDIVIGVDLFEHVLLEGVKMGLPGEPLAQQTIFGWVLSGRVASQPSARLRLVNTSAHHCAQNIQISDQIRKFWELEEIHRPRHLTPDEQTCEDHFRKTHARNESGRYIVRLPFRNNENSRPLGDSRRGAISLLTSSERRKAKDPQLQQAYSLFMTEYLNLDHMVKIPVQEIAVDPRRSYYLPHHAVVKRHDSTNKIRVVFNASYKTSSGASLNDTLLTGPKLQSELWLILTRWRLFRIAFTTDIVKMYRQILVQQEDADFQRIVWRTNANEEVQDYRLLTVTYGTASAPFLALRTLQQLAIDERNRYPIGARCLETNSYVDDILAGADDVSTAQALKDQLIGILQAGCFELSKWASNTPALICNVSTSVRDSTCEKSFASTDCISTLGLQWNPTHDCFTFKVVPVGPFNEKETKRTVLSGIARLFDPLGWLAPVLVVAKILLQKLWLAGLDWDSSLPPEVAETWATFKSQLQELETLTIPRWVHLQASAPSYELHAFSDASDRAYAAVVYLRVTDSADIVHVNLLVAKTKVAPVKVISIPKLELCGALLLSRLVQAVMKGLDFKGIAIHAYTDSQVVLAWLRGHASKWTTFVANRVSEIQSSLPHAYWHHVRSASNPADCATRGVTPEELKNSTLWWHGPKWLEVPENSWPLENPTPESFETNLEQRTVTRAHLVEVSDLNELPNRFSGFDKLIRVTAYCLRFIHNLKNAEAQRLSSFLTAEELRVSRIFWVRRSQLEHFADEITALKHQRALSRNSPLRKLYPILDENDVLRVGGRLDHAFLPYDEKHPVILSKSARISTLLVLKAHAVTLHGGPQLTQSHLVRSFWIVNGASLIKGIIRRCVPCARYRATPGRQLMGQLPRDRVTPDRPFNHSGVDYAGPIYLRTSKGRGHKAYKGYICLFVCLATRAVHLEVVSDYSSASFVAAFKRFVSRRGHCSTMLSDNGTTFKGAARELGDLFNAASEFYRDMAASLARDGTSWSFIPPYTPHFGGLWEAGVKSVKYHLRRTIGDATLTFEEMTTLLTQIEACLNSRPICPLSNNPTDLAALTPGHLLVGSALTAVPEPSLLDTNVNTLSRWQLITNMRDHFWRRWSREYLHHLQERSKWTNAARSFQVNDLVLVKDDLLPPAKWNLGRVVETHPGRDGHNRVVTVRTATGNTKRSFAKLCLLPVHETTPAAAP